MKINSCLAHFAVLWMVIAQSLAFAQETPLASSTIPTPLPLGNQESNASADMAERPMVTGPLTLDQAVGFTLKNSPILRGAIAELDMASARIKAAQAASKPSLSATTFLTTGSENGPIYNSPEGVTPQNIFTVPHGPFINQNLMLMLPLFNGGRLQSMTKQAEAARTASRFDVETSRLDAALETKIAYRQALLAIEVQKVAAARQSATAEQLKNDRAAEQAGRVPQLYVMRDEAENADAEQDVTNAARDVEIAFITLRAAMGAASNSNFTLADSLETLDNTSTTSNLEVALEQRPELQSARARLESARQGESAARGASKVQSALTGMADLSRARSNSGSGLSVGVVVGIPIFDGGLRRAERDEASAGVNRAQADLNRLQIQVEREVANAEVTLNAARKNVKTAESALVAAQEAYQVALLRYEGGRATNAETLDALAALTRARTSRARALYEAQITSDQLARAIGIAASTPPGP